MKKFKADLNSKRKNMSISVFSLLNKVHFFLFEATGYGEGPYAVITLLVLCFIDTLEDLFTNDVCGEILVHILQLMQGFFDLNTSNHI